MTESANDHVSMFANHGTGIRGNIYSSNLSIERLMLDNLVKIIVDGLFSFDCENSYKNCSLFFFNAKNTCMNVHCAYN